MKRIILSLFVALCLLCSCQQYGNDIVDQENIRNNVTEIFNYPFAEDQDWCSTINSNIVIYSNTTEYNIEKVQVLLIDNGDINKSEVRLLNEATISNNDPKKLTFDIPDKFDNLFVCYITKDNEYFYKKFTLGDKDVYFEDLSTRTLSQEYVLPTSTPKVTGTIITFANQRNWLPGEVFYNTNFESMNCNDYSESFKEIFRSIIFNYFPNGRKYDNLPKIKESGYYNESSYPITTGEEPIILSPVYKNDGGYEEICYSELYYYYYDSKKTMTVADIEALPKYKAIDMNALYANNDNDNIKRKKSFVLAYYGDGIPTVGTTGTFNFPKGYKIGFVYKSNTTADNKKKQGEVYGDGRLNYNINKYGNFKSSGLGDTDPRMAWMTVNKKMFLCIESGTDKDYNDLIIEVEGGIEDIIIIPDPPTPQYYTFCYEDHRLGDYDMNDVVIKGTRLDETHVKYTLLATGGTDELYIIGINGEHLNSYNEVHSILGKDRIPVNVSKSDKTSPVSDVIVVNKEFSFTSEGNQPAIYNKTKNWEVYISREGEDPHAIMIPYDIRWPLECICVKDAYTKFNSWGAGLVESSDWYKYPIEDLVY